MIFRRAFVARCNQTARLFSWKVTVGDLSAMFRRISERFRVAALLLLLLLVGGGDGSGKTDADENADPAAVRRERP